jgi:hypothetical protein
LQEVLESVRERDPKLAEWDVLDGVEAIVDWGADEPLVHDTEVATRGRALVGRDPGECPLDDHSEWPSAEADWTALPSARERQRSGSSQIDPPSSPCGPSFPIPALDAIFGLLS